MKRIAMFLAPMAIAGVTLFVVGTGAVSAAKTRTGGVVHLYAADTAWDGNLDTEIYTGAITDHGTDHQNAPGGNLVVLSKGSFKLDVAALGNKVGAFPVDPKKCSFAGTASAPVPIVKGTGTRAYRGISGMIEVTASVAGIYPRLKGGKCNTNATKFPGVLIAKGSGFVTYK
jgi:hypothetical protein